jgi:ribonuclease E
MECLSRDRTKHQVAEVTSLGLVQMTRKRVGLGLLETFSEPCEACQGRGVVVHTEPVLKQRSSGSDSGSAKKKRPSKSQTAPSQATHQITDDARMAIAQIAAKTVGVAVGENGVVGASPDQDTAKKADTQAASEDPLGLGIPLPVKKGSPRKRKEDPSILEAVLNALPEPPTPGTSRRRRRASTQGVVTPGEKNPQDAAGEN